MNSTSPRLKHSRNRLYLVGAHEMVPIDGHGDLEPGTASIMPPASKNLTEATQLYALGSRRKRDHVLDPLARLDLVQQFERNAGRADIDRFPAALGRQTANLGDKYWQSQSVSLCTSLIQASNLRDTHHNGNG